MHEIDELHTIDLHKIKHLYFFLDRNVRPNHVKVLSIKPKQLPQLKTQCIQGNL